MISCDEEHPELRYIGTLDTGYYLLVTGTRLADGGVLARISSFVLPAQKDEFKPVATKVPYHCVNPEKKWLLSVVSIPNRFLHRWRE